MKTSLLILLLGIASLAQANDPLDRIHFPALDIKAMPIESVITIINEYASRYDSHPDPLQRGLNLLPIVPKSYANLWTPLRDETPQPPPTFSYTGKNVSLRTLLDRLCTQADLRYESSQNLVLLYPKDYWSGDRSLELIPVPLQVARDRFLAKPGDPKVLQKTLEIAEATGLISLSSSLRAHGLLKDPGSFTTYHKASGHVFAYLTDHEKDSLQRSPLSLETEALKQIRTMSQTPFRSYSVTNRGAHLVVADINRMIAAQHPHTPPVITLLATNQEKLTRVTLSLEHSSAYELLKAFSRVTGWTLRVTEKEPTLYARIPADEWQKEVYRIHATLDAVMGNEDPKAFFASIGMAFPPGARLDYDRKTRFLTVRNTRTSIRWLNSIMPRLNK